MNIALYEPDIPPNTGNIARLCAATGAVLHLIEPLGFKLTDKSLKRAGLDYWQYVKIYRHLNFTDFLNNIQNKRLLLFSTHGEKLYTQVNYQKDDVLLFGSETRGLPDDIKDKYKDNLLTIPMRKDCVRSLNLANSVAIVLYEALRQLGEYA